MALLRQMIVMGFKALSLFILIFSSASSTSGLVSAAGLTQCPCGIIEITYAQNEEVPDSYTRTQCNAGSASSVSSTALNGACYVTYIHTVNQKLTVYYNRLESLESHMNNLSYVDATINLLAVKCVSVEDCIGVIKNSIKETTQNFNSSVVENLKNNSGTVLKLQNLARIVETYTRRKMLVPPGTVSTDKDFVKEFEIPLNSYGETTTTAATSTMAMTTTASQTTSRNSTPQELTTQGTPEASTCPQTPCVCPPCQSLGSAIAQHHGRSSSTPAPTCSGNSDWMYIAIAGWIVAVLQAIPQGILSYFAKRKVKEVTALQTCIAHLMWLHKQSIAEFCDFFWKLREYFQKFHDKNVKLQKDVDELSVMLRYSYNSGVRYDIRLRQQILDAGGPVLELDCEDTQVSDDDEAAIMYKYKPIEDLTESTKGAADGEVDEYAKYAWRAKARYRKRRNAELKEAHLKQCAGCTKYSLYHKAKSQTPRCGKEATEYPIVPIVREVIPPNETKEQEELRKKAKEEARDRHRLRRRQYLEERNLTKKRGKPDTSTSRMNRAKAMHQLRRKCLVQDKYTEDIFGMTFRADDLYGKKQQPSDGATPKQKPSEQQPADGATPKQKPSEQQPADGATPKQKPLEQQPSDGAAPKQKVPAPNQIMYKTIAKDRPKQLVRRGNSVLVKRVVVGRRFGKPRPSRIAREVMALNGVRRKDREKNKDEIVPDEKTKTSAKKTPMEFRTRAALRAKKRFVRKCAVKAIRKHRRKAALARAKFRRAQAKKEGRPIGKKNAGKKIPQQGAAPAPAKGAAATVPDKQGAVPAAATPATPAAAKIPDKQVAAPSQGQSAPAPAPSKTPAVAPPAPATAPAAAKK